MTGDKPDERIRTPMQWAPRPGAGFTSGRPWQPLQSDSATTTVEAQDADPGSLLNLHRRLIHLRAREPALGRGRLLPLRSGSDRVAAYLRREGGRAVLVVANLGSSPEREPALRSEPGALPPGRYEARDLLDGSVAADLVVGADGALAAYAPMPSLAPLESRVLGLTGPAR